MPPFIPNGVISAFGGVLQGSGSGTLSRAVLFCGELPNLIRISGCHRLDQVCYHPRIPTSGFYPNKAEDFCGHSYHDTLPFGTDGIPDVLYEAKVGVDSILTINKVSNLSGGPPHRRSSSEP